jgi:hypothetical protein
MDDLIELLGTVVRDADEEETAEYVTLAIEKLQDVRKFLQMIEDPEDAPSSEWAARRAKELLACLRAKELLA